MVILCLINQLTVLELTSLVSMTRFRVVVVSILGLTLDLLPLCQRNPENTRSTSLAGYFQPTLRLTDPQAGDFGGENVVTPKVSLEMLLSRLVPELLAAKREKCRTPTQGTETISAQRGDSLPGYVASVG